MTKKTAYERENNNDSKKFVEDIRNKYNEPILGIDLGTSSSAACICKEGKFVMVPSAEGFSKYGKSFPSYVAFTEDGKELVGEPAKIQAINNVEGTISSFKRNMGKNEKYHIRGKVYTPEVLTSKILQKIKIDSEEFLGEKIDKAIITVPANFNNNQRTATKYAAEIAGINVIGLVSEPIAASLAYGIDKSQEDEITILVFDLGGGTLDVTIMEIIGNHYVILSIEGNNNLGGNDIDEKLAKYLAEEIEKEYGINLYEKKHAELIRAAEIAKNNLSSTLETQISLPYIALDLDNNPISLKMKLTREQFESKLKPLVDVCEKTIKDALNSANLDKVDIDKIIFVGEPCIIIQKSVEDFMGKSFENGVDPRECVAKGAAIFGEKYIKKENDFFIY